MIQLSNKRRIKKLPIVEYSFDNKSHVISYARYDFSTNTYFNESGKKLKHL